MLHNKYYNWYYQIINNAKSENRVRTRKHRPIYYEKHHILPKSIYPEKRLDYDNLVLLTAREHYICHKLLLKIIPDSIEMFNAWILMSGGGNINSKLYDKIKNDISVLKMGKPISNKTKQKISATKKGIKQSNDHIKKRSRAISGENNGKFIGYYHTPAGVFTSSRKAALECGISASSIIKYCKNELNGYSFTSKPGGHNGH